MCGIVGVVQYKSEVPREIRHKALKILFSDTMLKTQARGEDATGLYQVNAMRPGEDYGDWAMAKKGVKVSEWLFQKDAKTEDPVVYSDFMDAWLTHDQELSALVGHCRKATVGSRGRDNDDNHPFAIQVDERNALLGIHNGTLDNHETIFQKLPKMLKRQGQVDSESIFHMLFHLSEQGTKPFDGEMLQLLGKRLDGSFACIVVNTKFPNLVATFRESRPLEYFMISPLNIVLMASVKGYVEAAIEKYDFIRGMLDPELPELLYDDRTLPDKDYRIFDTSLEFPAGKPIFADFDKISEQGDIRKFNESIDSEWKAESSSTETGTSTSTSHSGYSGGSTRAGSQSNTFAAKTTKGQADNKTANRQLADSAGRKKEEGDEITTVEVEIGGDEEAKKGLVRAKSLGICTHYTTESEVASSLGMTNAELQKLSVVGVANLVAQAHFNLGYAGCTFDSGAKVEEVLKKGVGQNKKLEKAETKKQRAQNHVWEQKQLITIMLSLERGGYPLTAQNVGCALTAFKELDEERRKDILKAAQDIFGDKNVQKVAGKLTEAYKKASEKNRRRKEKDSTAAE
jgi:hypothetical protein